MALRYRTIAADLAGRIQHGQWEIGAFLPSEPDLAAEYGCSRETVRAALKRLEDLGLISRRKGQGTKVIRTVPAEQFHSRLGSIEELTQYGQSASRSIQAVERVRAHGAVAALFGKDEGTELVRLTTLRRNPEAESSPVARSEVFLSPEDFQLVEGELEDSQRLVADLVAERSGRRLVRVLQSIQAVPLDEETAPALNRAAGDIGLRLSRRYIDEEGKVFALVISTHPGDAFVYESVLERGTLPAEAGA
ncbi:GntR family transcriptional regulator [Sinomonas sp. R1AF57]|nr:GntR family transcriptional regulator [Sinomonas sp. R1AF57]